MKTKGSSRVATGIVMLGGIYIAAYLLSPDIFLGRIDTTRYRMRLFQSEMHRRVFQPLCFLENLGGRCGREFSAEVRNHASLPPPE
jgi:hypothetical protein